MYTLIKPYVYPGEIQTHDAARAYNPITGISDTYTASYFTTGRFECFLHICTYVGMYPGKVLSYIYR
jgi:hypothetical protein